MNLQMLKKAMLAYVSAVKFVWSAIAYPLSIVGKKLMNLRGYKVYGNSIQDGTPTPDSPVEIESVGDLTKNLLDIDSFDSFDTSHIKYEPETKIITNNRGLYGSGAPFLSNITSLDVGVYSISCEVLPQYKDAMYIGVRGLDAEGNFKEYYKRLLGENMPPAGVWTRISVSITVDTHIDMTERSNRCGILIQASGSAENYNKLNLQIRNVMIAEGDVNDDYEPYHKYKIPVVARGKNMATAQQVYSNASNYSECIEDGRNCIRCISAGKSYAGINFKENTQYTVRFEAKTVIMSSYEEDGSPECLFAFTHTDGTRKLIVVYGSKDWKYYEATSYANKTIKSVGMYAYNYKHWIYINVDTFQIEEGATATTYEPYIAPVTTNIFLDKPLRKVGDYADYVDFEKQKVVRNVEVLDDTGTKTIDESLGVISPPTEETIKLPALPQFKGTTIYEVGTNIKPSGIEAKYC